MAIKITQEEFTKKFGQGALNQPAQATPEQGSISQAFHSGIDQAKAGYAESSGSQNPLTQIAGATKIAAGGINAALSPLAPITKPIGDFIGKGINYVADKVSGVPAVQNFATSPVGQATARTAEFTGDLSTIAGAVAGGEGAGAGAVKAVGKAADVAAPVINATGRAVKATGEGAYGLTVPPSEATSMAVQAYKAKAPSLTARIQDMLVGDTEGKPITEANTAARRGLAGTEQELGVQAKRVSDQIWNNEIQPKLAKVKGQVNMQNFISDLRNDIIKKTPELNRKKALLEGLDAFSENYGKVNRINLEKLQQYKEGWAKFIPEATYKGKPIGSALKDVQNLAAQKARGVIYKYVGKEGQQAYIDYGNLKSIMESGVKSASGDLAKKSLGRDVWQFIMDKAVTPIATVAGKVLYKTGEGMELVGNKGAKNVADVVGEKVYVQPKGREVNKVKITTPTKVKVKTEGKAANKIPLYGGSTAPKPPTDVID